MPDFRKNKKTIGSAAGGTASLAAAVYLQSHPTWGSLHPNLATGLYVLAAILCLFAVLQWPFMQGFLGLQPIPTKIEPEHLPGSPDIQKVGGDNLGRMIQAKAGVLHYHEAPQPVRPTPSPEPPQPSSPASPPDIGFEVSYQWMELVYDASPGLWREATEFDYAMKPRKSLVISFRRPVPGKGKGATSAIAIFAILKFTHSAGTEQVSRAYWLGRTYHEVVFPVGHEESLIIGSREGAFFLSHSNGFKHDGLNNDFDVPLRQVGERIVVPANGEVLVEISLFDEQLMKTIEQKKCVLTFSKTGQFVKGEM